MSKRKHLTLGQKLSIVRRHLVEKVPISDLCDELGIHATQIYAWQKQLFSMDCVNVVSVGRQQDGHVVVQVFIDLQPHQTVAGVKGITVSRAKSAAYWMAACTSSRCT